MSRPPWCRIAIDHSRIPKEIGRSITRDYDVPKIHRMALKLREEIETALWPYIDRETCLVADLADIEKRRSSIIP